MKKHQTIHCDKCGQLYTATKRSPNHGLHIILSVFTLGFWLIIYFLAIIESTFSRWSKHKKCKG